MKKTMIFLFSVFLGYLLGIASFYDGYRHPKMRLNWEWGLRDNKKDCLFFWHRVEEHSSLGTELFCVKNDYPY